MSLFSWLSGDTSFCSFHFEALFLFLSKIRPLKYQNDDPVTNCVVFGRKRNHIYSLVARRYSIKKLILISLQNLQKNTWTGFFFLIKLQAGGVKSTFSIEHLWAIGSVLSEIQSTFGKKSDEQKMADTMSSAISPKWPSTILVMELNQGKTRRTSLCKSL